MSRSFLNLARVIPLALCPLARRTILTHAPTATPGGSHLPTPTVPGALGGVDPRILAGLPEFIGEREMTRVNEWQAGLWERLQDEVRNNPRLAPIRLKWDNDKLDMTDLLSFTARDPALALAFNYASLLINNSYFLESLNADAPKPVPAHFSQLEERVQAYAEGIFGSGWLWLVKSGDGLTDFDVIPTFAAGTLLVTTRAQRGRDSSLPLFGTPVNSGATHGETVSGGVISEAASEISETSTGSRDRYNPRRPVAEITPLAVLNLFEHAYLGDRYGVFSRREYARDWFRSLDWDKVARRVGTAGTW